MYLAHEAAKFKTQPSPDLLEGNTEDTNRGTGRSDANMESVWDI